MHVTLFTQRVIFLQVASNVKPTLVIFVMDGSIGQAAFDQAKAFKDSVEVGCAYFSYPPFKKACMLIIAGQSIHYAVFLLYMLIRLYPDLTEILVKCCMRAHTTWSNGSAETKYGEHWFERIEC